MKKRQYIDIFLIFYMVLSGSFLLAEDHSKPSKTLIKEQEDVEQDSSRVEFFKLIQGAPELVSTEKEKVQLKPEPPKRSIASDTGKQLYEFLAGRTHRDPNKKITTFFEVRKTYPGNFVAVKAKPRLRALTFYKFRAGQIIRIQETAEEFLNRLRKEIR
ncbi:MAG: hypothetical protein D6797_01580, partial [Bdellovibrio sp.]